MIRSIIFDMDGVISDSEPLHVIAEKKTLADFGVNVSIEELQTYLGKGTKFMLNDFINTYHLDTTYSDLFKKHQENLHFFFEEDVQPIAGAMKLIRDMKSRGLDLAVASSSSHALIHMILKKLQILPFFKTIVSGDDVRESKPAPDIFLKAVRQLSCELFECVVIEDSESGIIAAKKAGLKCIGFQSPNSGDQNLNQADVVVNDLSSIHYQMLQKLAAVE